MASAQALEQSHEEQELHLAGDSEEQIGTPSDLIELFQISHLRACARHFSIFHGRYLSVHSKKPLRRPQRYWVDLAFLDSTPHFFVKTDRHSLYAAGALLGATLILALIGLWSATPWPGEPWWPAAVLTLTGSVIALITFAHRSGSLVRFHSQTGDAVLVELINNNPRRDDFNAYVRALIRHIQAVHKSHGRKPHEMLGAELREHRRLKEFGVLSDKVYDRARTKILRQHSQSESRIAAAQQAPTAEYESAEYESAEADVIEVTMRNGAWHTAASGELFEEGEKQTA